METEKLIYYGPRDKEFKHLIMSLLEKGSLHPKYIKSLTDEKSMKHFGEAFTASSADSVNNYERYEQIGDVSANKFIVWYAYKRFPQLDCTEGVKVVARLRINYGAKATFSQIAENLGFWKFITAAEDGQEKNKKYRLRNKKDLLEDTFEAFIGCVEYLLDKAYRVGVGYAIIYDILSQIFDEIPISLEWVELFDAKTRLKETFDVFPQLGDWVYIDKREDFGEEGHSIAVSNIYIAPQGTDSKPIKTRSGPNKNDFIETPREGWILIGNGQSSNKIDAQQKAAAQGIETLKTQGIYRQPPLEYQRFCIGKK